MSKPRYKWWSYVRWMIRLYPERVAELRRRQEANVTAAYGGRTPSGTDIHRSTENLGTVSLGATVDREMQAVRRALEDISALPNADLRLRIIEMYYWKRTHTLDGASYAVNVADVTGRRWNAEFIGLVAKYFGLLDDDTAGP